MPRIPITLNAMAAAFALASPTVLGQDSARGRTLYETHCGACHYERVHQRDRSRSLVRSRADLTVQIKRWAAQTGTVTREEDLADIAEYLNRSHYRLEK